MGGFKLAMIIFLVSRCQATTNRVPILDSAFGDVYHGTIKESDTHVELSPSIRIVNGTGPICKYIVTKYDNNTCTNDSNGDWSAVFDVNVLNKTTGAARLIVKPGFVIDCSDAPYRFCVKALRCGDSSLSNSALVEIRVVDTNNHEPRFERDWYSVEAEPGRLYDALLQLRAFDADCGDPYGEICSYEISDGAKHLFHISESGVLRNTQPLNVSGPSSFLLTVTAHDCGMRRSSTPAVVTVNVRQESKQLSPTGAFCRPTVDLPVGPLDYSAGQRALPVFLGAKLDLCPTNADLAPSPLSAAPASVCPGGVEHFEAKIVLVDDATNGDIESRQCDRENLALVAQKRTCGVDKDTQELLPNVKSVHIENEHAKKASNNAEDSEEVYMFDGQNNAVIVPESTSDGNFSNTFTLNFWMKRDKPRKSDSVSTALDQKHPHWNKEHVLCLSDDHSMNRHHFAIYAKHCKLEVLFRREKTKVRPKRYVENFGNGDNQYYEPAEWRWTLEQVCDNNWHHYSLNVEFPKIELIVDGVTTEEKGESPEILDDWPMHHVKDLKNKLVVGACWQGSTGKTYQHFKGYLSGLTILRDKLEKPSVLECLLQCKERLEFVGLAKLESGEEAIFNRNMNDLTLKAKNEHDFLDILQKISYVNTRSHPTVGDRYVRLITTLTCKDARALPVLLPVVETRINVKHSGPDVVELRLKGHRLILDHSESEIKGHGVPLFPDLKILAIKIGKALTGDYEHDMLDMCKLTSQPTLDKTREYFSSPSSLIGSLPNLNFEQLSDGLILKGSANIRDYQKVLDQIRYFNSRPNEFSRRVFSVRCTMNDGQLESNEFIVTLNIHKDPTWSAGFNESLVNNASSLEVEILPSQEPQPQSAHRVVAKKVPPPFVAPADAPRPSFANSARRLEMAMLEPKLLALSGHDPLGYNTFSPVVQGGPGGAIAIVAVICVGFLLLLVVLGMLKVRSTHKRLQQRVTTTKLRDGRGRRRLSSAGSLSSAANGDLSLAGAAAAAAATSGSDLTWDDAGMSLTINPIEAAAQADHTIRDDAYSDMSSDGDSLCDEDYSEEEDEDDEQVLPHLESNATVIGAKSGCHRYGLVTSAGAVAATNLEWDDDGALANDARSSTNSSSFHV